MSHHQLRSEKNCLNCGANVELRFCSNCGQENIEPRQTFGQLLAHFFEDLTHYEGKFWPTLRFLFFKPAFLTKEFLSGKRNRYLPPVRLYIFASFITFLLPGLIPDPPKEEHNTDASVPHTRKIRSTGIESVDSVIAYEIAKDSAVKAVREQNRKRDTVSNHKEIKFGYSQDDGIRMPTDFHNKKELDSAKLARSTTDDPMGFLEYYYNKKAVELLHNKYPPEEQVSIFLESLKHNVPKALFLYMPLFALILRLFHKRKNWIYFDHGIFTLHFFSFMLLTFLLMIILSQFGSWVMFLVPTASVFETIIAVILLVATFWVPFYLYKAHRKMYEESRAMSALKTTAILILNGVLFMTVLCALIVFTLFTMH